MNDTGMAQVGLPLAGKGEVSTIEIRVAIDADLPHLVQLMAEMNDLDVNLQDENAARKMRVTMDAMVSYPDFKIYMVLEDGLPVASFSLMIFCSPSHNGTQQALLDAVVVQRDRRSEGLGTIMLEHALRMAAVAGCYKLMLSSNITRADAHRFYENFGFSQHGISFSINVPGAEHASGLQ
ncbi:MAG: GNAT family N-acetyltransferase [Burkholderiaceae bacterium]